MKSECQFSRNTFSCHLPCPQCLFWELSWSHAECIAWVNDRFVREDDPFTLKVSWSWFNLALWTASYCDSQWAMCNSFLSSDFFFSKSWWPLHVGLFALYFSFPEVLNSRSLIIKWVMTLLATWQNSKRVSTNYLTKTNKTFFVNLTATYKGHMQCYS